MGKSSQQAVWCLDAEGPVIRLVRLAGTDGAWSVTHAFEHPRPAGGAQADLASATRELASWSAGEPVAVVVGDQAVLYRAVSLPAGKGAEFAAMLAGQTEVLIPGEMDRFAAAHVAGQDPHRADMRRVVLCAARRDAVDRALAAGRQGSRQVAGAYPSLIALAGLWAAGGTAEPVVLVNLDESCTSVAVVAGKCLLSAGVADVGLAGGAAVQPATLVDWARQVREVVEHGLSDLARDRRPARCLLLGPSAGVAGAATALAEALRLKVEPPEAPARLAPPAPADFRAFAPAIGAALAAVGEGAGESANLAPGRIVRRSIRSAWRWAALAGWLVIAAVALYLLDRREAAALADQLDRIRQTAAQGGGLQRRRAVAGYLESATPPLEILERLSAVLPPQAILSAWRYGRDGQHVIGGSVPNEKEFLAVLDKLGQIGHVRWKTGRLDQKKFQFEVHLSFDARAAARAATQPATDAEPATAPLGGAEPAARDRSDAPPTSLAPHAGPGPGDGPTGPGADAPPGVSADPPINARGHVMLSKASAPVDETDASSAPASGPAGQEEEL